jgi:hypothetical protein
MEYGVVADFVENQRSSLCASRERELWASLNPKGHHALVFFRNTRQDKVPSLFDHLQIVGHVQRKTRYADDFTNQLMKRTCGLTALTYLG